jgi:hypothetical protein
LEIGTDNLTPLHFAVAQTLTVPLSRSYSAQLDPIDSHAFENVLKTVYLLLENKADPSVCDSAGNTLLHVLGSDLLQENDGKDSQKLPHGVLVNKFIELVGPKILSQLNRQNETPLLAACKKGQIFSVLSLLPDELEQNTVDLCKQAVSKFSTRRRSSKSNESNEKTIRSSINKMSETYKATLASIGLINEHYVANKRARSWNHK